MLANFSSHREGVRELMEASGIELDKVCLLDPRAENALSPEDGDGRFEWFLFGVRDWKTSVYYGGSRVPTHRESWVNRFSGSGLYLPLIFTLSER